MLTLHQVWGYGAQLKFFLFHKIFCNVCNTLSTGSQPAAFGGYGKLAREITRCHSSPNLIRSNPVRNLLQPKLSA